jgi:hypothetical protein
MAALFEVGAADVADTSNDYYTPPWIFAAAALVFDVDVAAPIDASRRTCPARRYLTPAEDGLSQPWEGLVWMNPPYSNMTPWIDRFAAHRCGLALMPTLRRTRSVGLMLESADAITLLTVIFGRPDGRNTEFPNTLLLAACGDVATQGLARVAAADKYMRGAYHVRPSGPVLP